MTSIVQLLEKIGTDASLRHSKNFSDIAPELSEEQRSALDAKDPNALKSALGFDKDFACIIVLPSDDGITDSAESIIQ